MYLQQLKDCFDAIEALGQNGRKISPDAAVTRVTSLIKAAAKHGSKVMIIGNGGSATIASHMAVDLLKNAEVPALAFNDSGVLTCLANDLGYGSVFEKPIEMLSKKGDILLAISSSGRSASILNAVKAAKKKAVNVVTLSGFLPGNPLKKMGNINFFVPSSSYGFVELTHSAICHWISDSVILKRSHG